MEKGDRVRMTEKALEQRFDTPGYQLMGPSSTGVVVSVIKSRLKSEPDNRIRVLRDHRKTVKTYHVKFWEKDNMELQKAIDEIKKRDDETARTLPAETKRVFWKTFYEDGLSIGEARKAAGIENVSIAVALIIQCYKKRYIPMEVEEIE